MFSQCVSVSDTSPFNCPYCASPSCAPKMPTKNPFIFSGQCPSNVCVAAGKNFFICELCPSTQTTPSIYGCTKYFLRDHPKSKKHEKYLKIRMNELPIISSEGTSTSPSTSTEVEATDDSIMDEECDTAMDWDVVPDDDSLQTPVIPATTFDNLRTQCFLSYQQFQERYQNLIEFPTPKTVVHSYPRNKFFLRIK